MAERRAFTEVALEDSSEAYNLDDLQDDDNHR